MKKVALFAVVVLSTLLFVHPTMGQSVWTLDKNHAKLGFTITHLMVSEIEGNFKNFDAKITAPKEDFSDAVVEMTAETNSINTDNEKRDNHLKTPDFFDAAVFTAITFKSTSFKKTGPKNYVVVGNLTMHGVTKPVTLDVICNIGENPQNKKPIAGFKVTGTIKRTDFGIGTKFPSAMVGDEVSIVAHGEFGKD